MFGYDKHNMSKILNIIILTSNSGFYHNEFSFFVDAMINLPSVQPNKIKKIPTITSMVSTHCLDFLDRDCAWIGNGIWGGLPSTKEIPMLKKFRCWKRKEINKNNWEKEKKEELEGRAQKITFYCNTAAIY